ncbi:MAG: HNH endonuclease, partial [bacterium]
SRHIPASVRDEVFARDGGRCTFVGPEGKRCGSRWNIQVDHIVPYGKGGDSSPENLRLLCAKHNNLEAGRAYGVNKIKKYRRRE